MHFHLSIGDVNAANIEQLKMMNITSLPVRYTDKFYRELVEKSPKVHISFSFLPIQSVAGGLLMPAPHDAILTSYQIIHYIMSFYTTPPLNLQDYLKFAFCNGFAVGAVCSRIEACVEDPGYNKLYIMTISILPAYRRRGIGKQLLNHIIDTAMKDASINEAYLHVQTSNEDAKQFYIAHGFEETETIRNYYKRIEPPDCYVLKKKLREV